MQRSRSITGITFLALASLSCQTITNLVASATPIPTATPLPSPTPAPIDTPIPVAEYEVPDEGRDHIEFPTLGQYDHYPPSSGVHYGRILEWGFYQDEIPPEYWVHSLEHGGIVILYNCSADCQATEDALWQLMDSAPPEVVFNEVKILISPNSQIESPVVALAWGRQLDLDFPDYDTLLNFYQRYVNQGPELAP